MNTNTKNGLSAVPVKVSVIIPIYNSKQYLEDAIKSIQTQTLHGIEIICVDDGSTDQSPELLSRFCQKDKRIRVFTQKHTGPSSARNFGLAQASGEYVSFLDSDDFFEPTMLEKLYNLASGKSLDIAICRFDVYHQKKGQFRDSIGADHSEIFQNGRVTSKSEFPDVILQSTSGYVWNKLFRRKFLLEKSILFPEGVSVFEDVFFTANALSLAERVAKTQEVLLHHRVYADQTRARLFRRDYAIVPKVFLDLKECLMQHGLYAPLSKSFLNLSASRCNKVFTLLPLEARRDFWSLLHTEYAAKLGWDTVPLEAFESEEVAAFCADLELHTYARHLRLKARGLLSPKRWKTALSSLRWTKRVGQQFKRFWNNIKPVKHEKDEDPPI